MKSLSIAVFCLLAASNVLAETPYKHQYENGGYFEISEETETVPQDKVSENKKIRHEYINDGHFGNYAHDDATQLN